MIAVAMTRECHVSLTYMEVFSVPSVGTFSAALTQLATDSLYCARAAHRSLICESKVTPHNILNYLQIQMDNL